MRPVAGPTDFSSLQQARGVVFTDLDGTLLDPDTYEPSPASAGLIRGLRDRLVPIIPVTSKTSSEVKRLKATVALAPLAVVEGGSILMIDGASPRRLGPPRIRLIDLLKALQEEGWLVTGLSEMDDRQVAGKTGLSLEAAGRALDREASEPFVFEPDDVMTGEKLKARVEALGGSLARGDRLWHLLGRGVNKGAAIQAVREEFPKLGEVPSAGIGDAWNDLDMLAVVDRGYMLGNAVSSNALPEGTVRIAETGPADFIRAIERFVHEFGL